jgi:ABC-2 type transport system ATP-binding protein
VITVDGLTKRFGSRVAVDDLSFEIRPGVVTGFLGPNGAGKSTTMRCIVGLDHPTAGRTTVDGKPYRDWARPLTKVGAVLEAKAFHPKRSARNHLRVIAAANGLPMYRVDEALEIVGLDEVMRDKAGSFSLGMAQRLSLGAALLGAPEVLILDEPMNGLDPEGIQWMRAIMRHYAKQNRTVFVSSHLLSEMAAVAQDLVVIGRGKLISAGPIDSFVREHGVSRVRVRSPQLDRLRALIKSKSKARLTTDRGALIVTGLDARAIGELAGTAGIVLHELSPITATLEDAFLGATAGAEEFAATGNRENPDQVEVKPAPAPEAGR